MIFKLNSESATVISILIKQFSCEVPNHFCHYLSRNEFAAVAYYCIGKLQSGISPPTALLGECKRK